MAGISFLILTDFYLFKEKRRHGLKELAVLVHAKKMLLEALLRNILIKTVLF